MSIITILRTFVREDKCMSKELILRLLPKLNESELDEIIATIGLSKFKSDLIKLRKEVQETRYSNGHFEYPVCHGTHIVKNGTRNGVSVTFVEHVINRSVIKPLPLRLIQRRKQRYGLNTLVV